MIVLVADICMAALAVSIAMCLGRLLRGPSVPDRALALDTIAFNLIGIIVLLCVRYNTVAYFDAAMVIAVIGFLGTTAVSKFLLKGDIVD